MDLKQYESSVVDVETWLPLRTYKLTLRHKLLSELGEISHFILKLLKKDNIDLQQLELITGLSSKQLAPVIQRLEGLKLIRLNTLTDDGKLIAYILDHIHAQHRLVAIDRHYKAKQYETVMSTPDKQAIELIPDNSVIIPSVASPHRDWHSDCFAQTERLRKNMHAVLPWLIPDFAPILSQLESKRWGNEWDISLQVSKEYQDNYGIPLTVEPRGYNDMQSSSYQNESKNLNKWDENRQRFDGLRLYTPLLVLETEYQLPAGIDWSPDLALPDSQTFVYSFIDEDCFHDVEYLNDIGDAHTLVCESDPTVSEVAPLLIEAAQQQKSSQHHLFNRQHTFSKAWLQHEYSYKQLLCLLPDEHIYKG